jgi:hypothetical protein
MKWRKARRHFYLHVKDGGNVFQDEEGTDLASLEAARQLALQTARELLCHAIKAAKPTAPEALVIADESGQTLEVVPLLAVLPDSLRR